MRPSKAGVTISTRHLPSEECPKISQVLARVGEKWSVLIIIMLAERSRRFSELKRAIGGVSQRMLTLSLRGLERDGLVKRTVFPVVPPRVEYELTPLGQSLRVPVSALGEWARGHLAEIDAAREAFDRREATEADKTSMSREWVSR
ncbi:MAG TPA: helix-turn-helix domain-containing protein [Steroidobacteraceae bacterium]|nr:helix-turn-helix domain-containing protein [Steroidobacteraceae bacterium]